MRLLYEQVTHTCPLLQLGEEVAATVLLALPLPKKFQIEELCVFVKVYVNGSIRPCTPLKWNVQNLVVHNTVEPVVAQKGANIFRFYPHNRS